MIGRSWVASLERGAVVSTAWGHSGPRDGCEQEGPAPGCVEARRELDPELEKDLLVSSVFRPMSYFSGRVPPTPGKGEKGAALRRECRLPGEQDQVRLAGRGEGPTGRCRGGVSQDADVVGLRGL